VLRDKLAEHAVGAEREFRWRGHEITRIEGLSDAVFAFAVTLLVVSLEVPKTFDELSEMMRGFGAFGISFVMLIQLWYAQYLYFRRYGLQDARTIALNIVLLFLVLFYVYPLKFLFTFLITMWTGGGNVVKLADGAIRPVLREGQMGSLMIVYGLGMIAVFAILGLLYVHASRRGEMLDLTPLEAFDTRTSALQNFANAGVGALSVTIVLVFGSSSAGIAGLTYMIIPIVQTALGLSRRRYRRRITTPA
jgi:uncharacterized membrane protein